MGSKNVLWAVRTDGQEFQIEASISQVITSGKKLFTVILRDVTERVQAEAVREHLAAVVDSSDDAIISKDLSGIINAWNRGAEKIFGYPAAEAVGKPMTMLMPPDRVNEEPAILTRIQRGESVEHFETVRVRKDGTKIDVSVTISPIRDVNGAIVGASKITRDITERKRAEEALQEQAQIMDSAQVFVRDMHSRVVFWPKGAEKLYGFTRQEAVGVLSHDLFDTKFPESLEMVEKKLFETGMWEGELIHTRRDGSIIVVSSAWVLHRDKQGQPIRILETNIDITARKRAEESLRDSEERFLAMANGIPQLAWMAEADGNIFWYNKRFYEYTGTTLEQMKGWGWEKVHDPEVLPKVLEGWREAIAAGTPFEMEFPLRGADGKFGAFLTRIVPVKDAAGRVTRWFGTNTDIGEIKQAQGQLAGQAKELSQQAKDLVRSGESLEAQSTMLNLVLENMAEGLVAADLEGHFLIWNDAARRLMGRDALELPSHQWTDRYQMFLPDGVTPYPTESLPLVRALRGESTLQEMVVRHSAEPEIFLEVTARPMKDRKGNFCSGVVVFRDITKRRSDELEIRKLNEELEERVVQRTAQLEVANHELEAFTYSVSHDLRAPLRHIGGYSKILSEDFGSAMPAEAQSHVKRIEDGVDRMVLLVDELLNLARVGRRALKLRSTNLNWVIEEVVSLLQPEAEGRQVTWKIAELPAAECDPVLVKQVFQNLIANALKFTRTRERAVVEISQRQENGQMVIVICDNGVGFNMKYQDKLFGVFQRLHRDEDFEGTGIGLATVKRIVHKHGGRVWAEAELDKGATFYFTLGAESADVKTKEDKNKAATA
jgi:PAS domain S-box-containing protein